MTLIELDETGCLCRDALPDGRQVGVAPLLFGAQICIGRVGRDHWDDLWHYADLISALVAYACGEPLHYAEPAGWIRHAATGRRREGGDPAKETVRP